jgi:hypothetical protein
MQPALRRLLLLLLLRVAQQARRCQELVLMATGVCMPRLG